MSVVLHVDRAQWRSHLSDVAARVPGLVPVAKGNGYGFGIARLAREAARLEVGALALGTSAEIASARDAFAGDLVILQPWRPAERVGVAALSDERVVRTVSRVEDLAALGASATPPRVLIEVLTSMRRHGIPVDRLAEVAPLLRGVRCEGWTFHLPLAGDPATRAAEAQALARAAAAVTVAPLWVSHVEPDDARRLADELATDVRLRMGTPLWLGAPESRRVTATVLDVHAVAAGERIGYWARRVPRDGYVVVLSGGTAHGIALEAPSLPRTPRGRVIALAEAALRVTGRARSPFTIGDAKRWFVEPPHMQASMVFLPAAVEPPVVGAEVTVEVRLTTATVDEVRFT